MPMADAWQRLSVALAPESTPFVGRQEALAALCAGRRPACVVVGEAGVGKSRLLGEARRLAGEGGFCAACLPGADALDPLLTLVRSLHRAGLVGLETVRALAAAPEHAAGGLVREALEQAAARCALTLQIDDLDEADPATLRALRQCVDRLQRLPVRWHFAASGYGAGAELVDQLRRAQQADVIELDDLTREETALVARLLAHERPLDDATIVRLYERTAGNPLYLESLLAHGSWDGGAISAELRRSLNLRLGALPVDAALIAGWVAVHGGSAPLPLLRSLSGFSPARLRTALGALEEARVLSSSENGARFRHGLLRDACYAALHDPTRIAHHSALEALAEDDWERAAHLDGACRVDETVALYNRLGWECLERGEAQPAREAFGRAGERAPSHSAPAYEALAGRAAAACREGRHDEVASRAGGVSRPLPARCPTRCGCWRAAAWPSSCGPAPRTTAGRCRSWRRPSSRRRCARPRRCRACGACWARSTRTAASRSARATFSSAASRAAPRWTTRAERSACGARGPWSPASSVTRRPASPNWKPRPGAPPRWAWRATSRCAARRCTTCTTSRPIANGKRPGAGSGSTRPGPIPARPRRCCWRGWPSWRWAMGAAAKRSA